MKQSILNLRKIVRKTTEIVRSARIARSISYNLPEKLIPFIIISEPRSGSNLFCSLINSHPHILCFYEMFHRKAIYYGPKNDKKYDFGTLIERDSDPIGFLSKIYSSFHGYEAVGIKMFNNHNNVVLRAMIKNKDIKKILLRRKASLHAFTSLMIARMNNDYILVENKEMSPQKKPRIHIDIESFKIYSDNRENFYRRTQRQIGNQPYVDLDYIDIIKKTEKFKNIIPFIGVDDSYSLETITRKQNFNRLEERIENFDEVIQSLSQTKYAKYLKEELE